MDDASSLLGSARGRATPDRPSGALATALLYYGLAPAGLAALAAGLLIDREPVTWAGAVAAAAGVGLLIGRVFTVARRSARVGALLGNALEGLPAGQLLCDERGKVVFVNAAFRELTGQRTGERPIDALERQFAADPDSAREFSRLRDRVHAGAAASAELAVPGPDGRPPEWRRVQGQPVEGFPGSVHWRVEDITARRELEQVMLREQSKLADFMEHAPVGFFSVDQDGQFLFVNATLAKWLGGEPGDLTDGDRRLHDILEEPPEGAAPYDLFEGSGPEQRGELGMRGFQGRRFQASVAQSVVVADDGGSIHTRSVVRDLTPEHEWREALRLSEQRFQRFFEDAPIGIALVDEEGRLTECNQAFLGLIGSEAGSVIGRPMAELIVPAEREAVATRLASVQGGDDPAAPLEVRLSGGRELTAQLYARRLGGVGGGSAAGLILHFIDMTERKSLEAQFAQSQKMQAVGQLAGGVAHDFNNLLTAMIGFCDLLLLRHKPGDQSFSDIVQIKQNANRAANLVRQLLAFSRQQTLQPRVINVTDVLAELANLLRRLIGENIELKMIHGRDLGLVKVDQNQLEQVIINLVVNARDAMGGGGRLTVVTSNHSLAQPERREHETVPAGSYVSIEVIDTGCGIARENLQRIFEPFYTTKEVGSGTGLGLSTVYGIVRQTGGFVLVDSAVGEGTTFTILLPRHQGEVRPVDTAEPRERRGSDLTGSGVILLVEDEDAVRVFSARALRNKGYQVLEAKNGEAALQQIESDGARIDLLITDVVMPQMDGPTLARHVRRLRPEMRVIFISGYAEDRLGDVDGVDVAHFLPKPFSLKQLASKVKEVIRDGR
ncbi:two-component system cell cycle sensor histidine kinase/response regulator CckA [Azospirillum agricola]|uniref:PAS domain-containing hybrid sensor histidine kinase/response regulator n=1 Tax=Azospirillum agricola TaxID=1720247 RepID=UPI001AE35134|nr:PAS domain S-box protein [Azospirillum agricola]MBP2229329.1 two-component system cell cycle sensor histidine kinase/response regulator CckA [Azospirillum agricola]